VLGLAATVTCNAVIMLSAARLIRSDDRLRTSDQATTVSQPVPEPAPAAQPLVAPRVKESVEPLPRAHFARSFDVSSFRRGNLHTHSNRSDGDTDPADVYAWYRDHGYDFVAITDHNTFTDPAEFRSVETPGFIVIGGEELTMRGGGREVHVNGLCTNRNLPGGTFKSAADALYHGLRAIGETGGITLINHPNFHWGVRPNDLPSAYGASLIEIESGHPSVRPLGSGSHPSCETLWDMALTAGLDFMGVAVDDAHHFRGPTKRVSGPGRAWIDVFATTLDAPHICEALENGQLYASNGPSLARISVLDDTYSIWPADAEARVQFVGTSGKLLAERKLASPEAPATYKIEGSEGYVRARVLAADGKVAWTPAVRILPPSGQAHATEASQGSAPPI
jgi:hypothetical protein